MLKNQTFPTDTTQPISDELAIINAEFVRYLERLHQQGISQACASYESLFQSLARFALDNTRRDFANSVLDMLADIHSNVEFKR